ncbi:hypothetical protein BGZ63DRAFT_452235 [Mariannaea sp. PMI_226]|nr:hypothetical protein BGZ63DRAFT_452235 [Mariannaea sp. PMI_226]
MTQPSPDPAQPPTDIQFALCNLSAMCTGAGIGTALENLIDDLDSRGPTSLCIILRDKLYDHLRSQDDPVPVSAIRDQVIELQDKIETHKGKSFDIVSAEEEPAGKFQPIDILHRIAKVGVFEITKKERPPQKEEECIAVSLGYVLGGLGKVIPPGVPITMGLVNAVMKQYQKERPNIPHPGYFQFPPPPQRHSIAPALGSSHESKGTDENEGTDESEGTALISS